MTGRPIEGILNEARALLDEAATKPMGGLWRNQYNGWLKDAEDWAVGYQDHEDEQVELDTEKVFDPATEQRLSNLEVAMTQLALAVVNIQTMALGGAAAMPAGKTRWQLAQDLDPEAEVELLDGSKIKVKDVPLGPDGMPEEEWAMANCPCPTHEEKRSRKAAAEQQTKGPDGTGLYL